MLIKRALTRPIRLTARICNSALFRVLGSGLYVVPKRPESAWGSILNDFRQVAGKKRSSPQVVGYKGPLAAIEWFVATTFICAEYSDYLAYKTFSFFLS